MAEKTRSVSEDLQASMNAVHAKLAKQLQDISQDIDR